MATVTPVTRMLKDGREVVVRHAVEGDAVGMINFLQAVLAEDHLLGMERDEFHADIAREEQWIESHLQADGMIVLLAVSGAEVVGVCSFANGPYRRSAHDGLLGLSVHREWRGVGVGRVLLDRLIEWAERHVTLRRLTLKVAAENRPAIALYEKLGFVEEGRLRQGISLPNERYVDELVMARAVK